MECSVIWNQGMGFSSCLSQLHTLILEVILTFVIHCLVGVFLLKTRVVLVYTILGCPPTFTGLCSWILLGTRAPYVLMNSNEENLSNTKDEWRHLLTTLYFNHIIAISSFPLVFCCHTLKVVKIIYIPLHDSRHCFTFYYIFPEPNCHMAFFLSDWEK